jgi:hypothetical protein
MGAMLRLLFAASMAAAPTAVSAWPVLDPSPTLFDPGSTTRQRFGGAAARYDDCLAHQP